MTFRISTTLCPGCGRNIPRGHEICPLCGVTLLHGHAGLPAPVRSVRGPNILVRITIHETKSKVPIFSR